MFVGIAVHFLRGAVIIDMIYLNKSEKSLT